MLMTEWDRLYIYHLRMCIFFVLRGHPTLEATAKNVAYGNKSKLFFCTYTFFFVPLQRLNPLHRDRTRSIEDILWLR